MAITERSLTALNMDALFTIPKTDMDAIKARVKTCKQGAAIKDIITRHLPHFPDALAAAYLWDTDIAPQMKAQCNLLMAYATKAKADFSALNIAVQQLIISEQDMTPAVQQQAATAVAALYESTKGLSASFINIVNQVFTFNKANNNLDSDIAGTEFGFMKEITASIAVLDHATGSIRGAWSALADDLEAIAKTSQVDFSIPFIAGLSLSVAIAAWDQLQTECDAFLNSR
ncbi:hypothetical protein [Mucilaginibacter ginsenosidivorax]|uniref:Uncharacterized protein n=1 Tax=Mucilaginibacter ginsenosidivorax TaxID=862126 RepID=A0A5B8VU76_9SPHI|nr:hypothetical protein [Mucilaginibacter ginsenosidivorax]QEC75010.1 hypothetical protein FSB76_03235 [Mucilaginibacter ginsenosidivorax]